MNDTRLFAIPWHGAGGYSTSEALTWAKAQECRSPAHKLTLVMLADGERNEARLARTVGVTVAGLSLILRDLIADGQVELL